MIEALKRNARQGNANKFDIREEDKRFKTWEMVTEPQRNAVIFAMRDVSARWASSRRIFAARSISGCCAF
jgi:uncharacterized sporulation protein YeaH/YhbH (DUF444 family)